MATEKEIIDHLRKLSRYADRPLCDEDGMPYYANGGNCDDTYDRGSTDGEIMLAKQLIATLDNGGSLPELPRRSSDDKDV